MVRRVSFLCKSNNLTNYFVWHGTHAKRQPLIRQYVKENSKKIEQLKEFKKGVQLLKQKFSIFSTGSCNFYACILSVVLTYKTETRKTLKNTKVKKLGMDPFVTSVTITKLYFSYMSSAHLLILRGKVFTESKIHVSK